MDESMVMVCMQIITNTGSAKSSYIEAIQKAKKGDLGGAEVPHYIQIPQENSQAFQAAKPLENYIAADWTRKCMARKSRK